MFCSRTRHRQDSEWSWFACFCASVNQVLQIGFSVSFGVLLPELMKEFNESRQNTGGYFSISLLNKKNIMIFATESNLTFACFIRTAEQS